MATGLIGLYVDPMKHFCLILILAGMPAYMTSCASSSKKPSATLAELSSRGVNSSTLKRIQSGRVLGFDDILNLVQLHISEKAIVAYLQSTHAPYRFTTSQLEQLSGAGAGSNLVNYLGKSIGYYEATKRNQVGGSKWDNHPYFNDPAYWGPAPFDYGFPGDWYEPGYIDVRR